MAGSASVVPCSTHESSGYSCEMHGRYEGDMREIYGRYKGDMREI